MPIALSYLGLVFGSTPGRSCGKSDSAQNRRWLTRTLHLLFTSLEFFLLLPLELFSPFRSFALLWLCYLKRTLCRLSLIQSLCRLFTPKKKIHWRKIQLSTTLSTNSSEQPIRKERKRNVSRHCSGRLCLQGCQEGVRDCSTSGFR